MDERVENVLQRAYAILKKQGILPRTDLVTMIEKEFGENEALVLKHLNDKVGNKRISKKILDRFKEICEGRKEWHSGRRIPKGDNGYWTYEPK